MIEVVPISDSDTRALRHLVLWPHLSGPEVSILDTDGDSDALHLGAFLGEELVGICSVFSTSSPKLAYRQQRRLRAMATHPSHRGSGAGRLLVLEALKHSAEIGSEVVWCDAREKATGFYGRMGFIAMEERYEIPLIGIHQFMYYPL